MTSSCTTALHLSLSALGIKKGDEVLCPALTFIAPANMIALTNAKIKLVDIDPLTYTIDPKLIEKKITKNTKAIIVVHQFGHAAKMDEIMKIAKKYNLKVIEDNAEGFCGYYKNKKLGTIGDMSTLSFYANKVITTGEGGAILTNNTKLAEKCKLLRDHGLQKKNSYKFVDLGFNYRMTNLQAAVGISQMMYLKKILTIRNRQMKLYYELLSKNPSIKMRKFSNWCKPVHWLTNISLKKQKLRDKLILFLKKNKIDARPMVPPVHHSTFFKKFIKEKFIISERVSKTSLHLPSSTQLEIKQIKKICKKINNFIKE